MRIQQYLHKLSWAGADKLLFIGYGFVNLAQIKAVSTEEFAHYALLNALYLFIVSFSDISILQIIVRFGNDVSMRGWANSRAVLWHSIVVGAMCLGVMALKHPIALWLREPQFPQIALYIPCLCIAATPRMIALKFLYRDTQPKILFIVNAAWFGVMTALTVWMLANHTLRTFREMFLIAVIGLVVSSCVALILTRKQFVFTIQKHITQKEALRFIGYQGIISFTSNIVKQLDVYIVQYYFGGITVGTYQSAKTLFRFVEAIFDGINGLLYPGVLRLSYEQRDQELRTLLIKVLSFSFLIMATGLGISLLGGASLGIKIFLSPQYQSASGYFTVLMMGAVCMAFSLMTSVMAALDELRTLLLYILIAGTIGIVSLIIIGSAHLQELVPIGFVMYHASLGGLSFQFIRTKKHLPLLSIFRAVPDIWNFLRHRFPRTE
jgi:O-antigen/teichoic acid export membrane protein